MTTYRPLPRGMTYLNGRPEDPSRAAGSALVADAMSARWSALEPSRGQFVFDRVLRALDYAEAAGMTGADLRVYAGSWSPDDVKAQVGSFPHVDGADGPKPPVPCFWKPGYGERLDLLLVALAEQVGGHPALRSVSANRTMYAYAEPFMDGNPPTEQRAEALGLTRELLLATHLQGIDAHARILAPLGLRLRYALNPSPLVEPVVEYALRVLPGGVVLQNNSVRSPLLRGFYPAMYAQMAAWRDRGVPVAFQTAGWGRLAWAHQPAPTAAQTLAAAVDTLRWAAQWGAVAVEPPAEAWRLVPADVLREVDAALRANAARHDAPADDAAALRAQLAEVTADRDTLAAVLAVRDGQVAELERRAAAARGALDGR